MIWIAAALEENDRESAGDGAFRLRRKQENGFRDREKRRLVPLKPELFSAEACEPGCYGKNRQDFCLRNDRASENLHASIRDVAVDYFRERDIPWHDGIGGGPSNHLCCSQSFCVNFWFPFRDAPGPLAAVLRGLGFDAARYCRSSWTGLGQEGGPVTWPSSGLVSGIIWGKARRQGRPGRRTLARASLHEPGRRMQVPAIGRPHPDRFREWKYTEYYSNEQDMRFSDNGTDRLNIYKPSLDAADCQIVLDGLRQEALFFDPFDQLMRQQLLCSAMEREGEMDADVVSLLHIAAEVEPGIREARDVTGAAVDRFRCP